MVIYGEGEEIVIRLRKRTVKHVLWAILTLFSIVYSPSILFTIADEYSKPLNCRGWVVDQEFNSACLVANAEEEMFLGEGRTATIKPEYRDQRIFAPLMARLGYYSLRVPWSQNLATSIRNGRWDELLPRRRF